MPFMRTFAETTPMLSRASILALMTNKPRGTIRGRTELGFSLNNMTSDFVIGVWELDLLRDRRAVIQCIKVTIREFMQTSFSVWLHTLMA
jgi:hypothetical protein